MHRREFDTLGRVGQANSLLLDSQMSLVSCHKKLVQTSCRVWYSLVPASLERLRNTALALEFQLWHYYTCSNMAELASTQAPTCRDTHLRVSASSK